jgi:hypothetical protein
MNVRPRLVLPLLALLVVLAPGRAAAQAPWPFDQPPLAELRKSDRKVFAHYFTPFPLSLDNVAANTPDTYERNQLNPAGSPSAQYPKGRYFTTGGYMRQRPLPVAPQPTGVDYELVNFRTEVRSAVALGLDGFAVDLLGYGPKNTHWQRVLKLMDAAAREDADFRIMIMPDINASTFKPENDPDGATLTAAVQALAPHPSAYRYEGKLVVCPFNTHKRPAAWWKEWIDRFEKLTGDRIFFVPLFQDWKAHIGNFAPFSGGVTDWGTRESGPGTGNDSPKWHHFSRDAHAVRPGFLSMAPIGPQDFRPKDDPLATYGVRFWESNNSLNYRVSWANAIAGGADWVHLITWNDYGEAAEIAPSTGTQYAFYDLTAYYTAWFKTGRAPAITRDVIYYFHRLHHTAAPFSADQAAPFRRAGDTPASDQIELLAFLADGAPATLEIEVAGTVHTQEVGAGIQSFRVPLPATGKARPVFRLKRGGQLVTEITSAFEINNEIHWQDFLYRAGGSSRPPVSQR